MSKIGLKYPVYAQLTESGQHSFIFGRCGFSKGNKRNVSITTSDVKLYADDALAESDKSFVSGTVSFGIDELSDKAKVDLLGYIRGRNGRCNNRPSKELIRREQTTPANMLAFGFYGAHDTKTKSSIGERYG